MSRSRSGIRYEVSAVHLAATQQLLRQRGEQDAEGYCVWVGDLGEGIAIVRDVWPVSAAGDGAHARVAFEDVLALSDRVHDKSWSILAQVHSHPYAAFHSTIDDRNPISHQVGFLSIVVPNFAAGQPRDGWSLNEYLGAGRWRALRDDEIRRRLVIAGRREGLWRRIRSVINARRFSSRH